jgi:hypothetical protein
MQVTYRVRRLFWWWRARRTRNPLLSRPTKSQRLATTAALLVVLTAALGGVTAVIDTQQATVADAHHQAADTHRITATVLGDDDQNDSVLSTDGNQTGYTARLSWTWHGHRHVGDQLTMSAPIHGTTTTTWVDDNGAMVPRPLTGTDVTVIVVGVALGAALLVIILAVAAVRLYQVWNLRRRAKEWSTEWADVAPLWTRHHGFR